MVSQPPRAGILTRRGRLPSSARPRARSEARGGDERGLNATGAEQLVVKRQNRERSLLRLSMQFDAHPDLTCRGCRIRPKREPSASPVLAQLTVTLHEYR